MRSATAEATQDTSEEKPREPSFMEKVKFLAPFWTAPENKWKARLMLGGILALTVAEIGLTAGVGLGFQAALNALVAKDAATFALTGLASLGGVLTSALAGNTREFMTGTLSQNWRGWMSDKFNEAWLSGKAYLRFQQNKRFSQNPDQRIAETIPNVAGTTLGLTLGLFHSAVAVGTFSLMLWHISPLMLGAAVVCAAGSHAVTHWAGGSLNRIWRGIMDTEAKFRHALTRVRDNAKPIALAGFERVEKETLKDEFNKLDKTRRSLLKVSWRTGIIGWLNMSSVSIVPIAMMAPKFFAGTATIGGLELARQVYTQFYFALSWFPQNYGTIASWNANVSQLMEFHRDLEKNKAEADAITAKGPAPTAAPAPGLAAAPDLKAAFDNPKTPANENKPAAPEAKPAAPQAPKM